MTKSVGVSKYGAPGDGAVFGVAQLMANPQANQILELKRRFFIAFGYELEANEAIRSRPRQSLLYSRYEAYLHGGPYAALAAYPYTSTHDATRSGAVDFGARGGQALSTTEHQWLVDNGPVLGVFWTGRDFSTPEWWHFDVDLTRAEQIAPDDITLTDTFGGTPEEDDMTQIDKDNAKLGAIGFLDYNGHVRDAYERNVQHVYQARLGGPATDAELKAGLRIIALANGDRSKVDAAVTKTQEYKDIQSGKLKPRSKR